MPRSRRHLPSLSLLAAFEAVLRTGSTAAAARDLNLTQGAVSRLVATLEAQLGRPLFDRARGRLVPTAAARAYGRDVTRALDLIARATADVAANPGGGTLRLAVLPAFGSRWLAPRLPAFLAAHPGVTVNLATRLKRFNLAAEPFDAAIHFGVADWRDADHLHLFDERLVACAAPAVLAATPVVGAADVARLPLLQLETRPTAWAAWFDAQGVAGAPPRGMLFDQFAALSEAAIAGLGVALLPEFIAAPELAAGRLAQVCGGPVAGVGAYWLVWPAARADWPPLVAFRAWLAAETAPLR